MRGMNRWMQSLLNRAGTGKFYHRSLVTSILLTALPTAFIGLMIYVFGTAYMRQVVTDTHEAQIRQAVDRIDSYMSHLELTAAQWSFNPSFDEKIRSFNISQQVKETQDYYKMLAGLEGSDALIDQIQLYFSEQAAVISNRKGYIPLVNEADRKLYRSVTEQGRTIFWTGELTKLSDRDNWAPVSLVVKLPGGSVQAFGALVIHVNASRMTKLIDDVVAAEDKGAALLLKEDGSLISGGGDGARAGLNQALSAEVLRADKDGDTFIFKYDGEPYSVSYRKLARLGDRWLYVTATPFTKLTKPVELLSRILLGISLLTLLLGLLLSWLASRQLYRPVRQLLSRLDMRKESAHPLEPGDEFALIESEWRTITRESQVLQERLEQQLPTLRQSFLLQLVQGHLYSLSEQDIRDRMGRLGWDMHGKGFAIAIVQLTGFSSMDGRFSEGDEQLVTFAAANIIEELAKERQAEAELINFQDLTVGLLIAYESGQQREAAKRAIFRLLEEAASAVSAILRLQVTAVVGKLTGSMKDIQLALEEARQALTYADLRPVSRILDMEELLPQGREDVYYPFEAEKDVIQAVRMGREEEAVEAVAKFAAVLEREGGKRIMVQQGMLQLLGSVQYAMLQSGFQPHSLFHGANLFEQLGQIRETAEMVRFFEHKAIRPYMKELASTQNVQLKRLVEQIIDTMEQHYMKDISLEWCAEKHGTYPQKLSPAFRQITGLNFIDYLTRLRLDKAKELLVQTDMKVNDVAEAVGYQPSYFNRLFKKYEDVTPGQYREQAQRG